MRELGDSRSVRVLVVDDHPVVLQGIVSLLAVEPQIDVVGTAANGRECLRLLKDKKPDVILLDINLPDICGIDLIEDLQGIDPHLKIVLMTGHNPEAYYGMAIKRTIISKEYSGCEIVQALFTVLNIEQPCHEELDMLQNLTPREVEIMNLVIRGIQNKEIAYYLSIKNRTVEFHITNIFDKLEVSTRVEAVNKWIKVKSIPGN